MLTVKWPLPNPCPSDLGQRTKMLLSWSGSSLAHCWSILVWSFLKPSVSSCRSLLPSHPAAPNSISLLYWSSCNHLPMHSLRTFQPILCVGAKRVKWSGLCFKNLIPLFCQQSQLCLAYAVLLFYPFFQCEPSLRKLKLRWDMDAINVSKRLNGYLNFQRRINQ